MRAIFAVLAVLLGFCILPAEELDPRLFGLVLGGDSSDHDLARDNTAAIESALGSGSIFLPDGVMIVANIRVPVGRTVRGSSAAILKLVDQAPKPEVAYGLLWKNIRPFVIGNRLREESDGIRLMGFGIDGNAENQVLVSGQSVTEACGVQLFGAAGVRIESLRIVNTCFDAVYLGGRFATATQAATGPSMDIVIANCTADRIGRNFVSIVDARRVHVLNSQCANGSFGRYSALGFAGGWAGYPVKADGVSTVFDAGEIDLEPNGTYNEIADVEIVGNRITESHFRPLQGANLGAPLVPVERIIIRGNFFATSDTSYIQTVRLVGTQANPLRDLVFSENVTLASTGNPVALRLEWIDRGVVVGNVSRALAAPNYEHEFKNCANLVVTGNLFDGGTLAFHETTPGANANNIFSNNRLLNCADDSHQAGANLYGPNL